MITWVLIMALYISDTGAFSNVSGQNPFVIDGFQSEEKCKQAARDIRASLNAGKDVQPVAFQRCVKIEK